MVISILSVDSPSPGPAGPAAGWWSCLPGSTPPVTQCHRGHSRSPASFPGGSCVQTKREVSKEDEVSPLHLSTGLFTGATVNL